MERDPNDMIILAVSDLFFSGRIRATATQLGLQVVAVNASEKVTEVVGREKPRLVIVDLNDARFDAISTIAELKATPSLHSIRVLGFLSHVQTELRDAAMRAGCDLVVPRSKFTQSLPQLLLEGLRTAHIKVD